MSEAVQRAAGVMQANRRLMTRLVVIALGMFGFGFALVPFYESICEATGMRNVFQPDAPLARNSQVDVSRDIAVDFDANTQRLPWTFKPVEGSMTVHPGELAQVM